MPHGLIEFGRHGVGSHFAWAITGRRTLYRPRLTAGNWVFIAFLVIYLAVATWLVFVGTSSSGTRRG